MREGISITVRPSERRRLKAVLKNRNAPQKHVWRAQIVLLSAEGLGTGEIMRRTGTSKPCVWRWQERFMNEGVDGLLRDKKRKPGLPMKKGRAGTMTHDYKRNGTTTLFAALNVLEGKVIGRCMPRHRHQEFIRFLNAIDAEVPGKRAIHVVLDNYATHKHPEVLAWLARHKRFTFHFTPTSCSWLNAVEGYFAKLSRRRLRRGVFKSVTDLQAAINRFVAETNENPKPFVWTKNSD